MRVAFVNSLYPPFGVGGAEVTLQGLAEGLARRGWEAHVISLTPRSEPHEATVGGVQVHYLPAPTVMWPFTAKPPTWRRVLFQLGESWNPLAQARVRRLLSRLRPDVVQVHNWKGFSASVWGAARSLRLPLVQTLHDYTLVCPRSVMFKDGRNCAAQCASCRLLSAPRRRARALPSAYTAVSHRMIARMEACGAFPPGRSPTVIRGDNARPARPPSKPDAGRPMTFGFLGRLEPIKGVEVLIEAAALAALPQPVLVAGAGDGAYEQRLRALADPARVQFLGRTAPEDFFARVDVLVVPSVWEEPLGRVAHEAFAHGVPVVASRLGGLPEIVEDGVNGRLTAPRDPHALARVLRELSADRPQVERLAEAASRSAAPFERERILDAYERTLMEAIAR